MLIKYAVVYFSVQDLIKSFYRENSVRVTVKLDRYQGKSNKLSFKLSYKEANYCGNEVSHYVIAILLFCS